MERISKAKDLCVWIIENCNRFSRSNGISLVSKAALNRVSVFPYNVNKESYDKEKGLTNHFNKRNDIQSCTG